MADSGPRRAPPRDAALGRGPAAPQDMGFEVADAPALATHIGGRGPGGKGAQLAARAPSGAAANAPEEPTKRAALQALASEANAPCLLPRLAVDACLKVKEAHVNWDALFSTAMGRRAEPPPRGPTWRRAPAPTGCGPGRPAHRGAPANACTRARCQPAAAFPLGRVRQPNDEPFQGPGWEATGGRRGCGGCGGAHHPVLGSMVDCLHHRAPLLRHRRRGALLVLPQDGRPPLLQYLMEVQGSNVAWPHLACGSGGRVNGELVLRVLSWRPR